MNTSEVRAAVGALWDDSIIPTLQQYIRIPNQSPLYDPEWETNGYLQKAVDLAVDWVRKQNVPGLKVEVQKLEGRTPLIFIEIDGDASSTVLMYGHLDKQPPMVGWDEGLDAWTPVIRDGKLYGRGGADDGYAIFAAVTAVKMAKAQKAPHSRIVIIIECCEESGSIDLPIYIELLAERIGTPRLIVCLDSGCGNYEQLWLTTSLRGSIVGNLTVQVLTEGVHSGDASGIVPSSFRILRQILDRLEDSKTGRVVPEWLWVKVPENRLEDAKRTTKVLGDEVWDKFPWVDGMTPMAKDNLELLLNRTWRPTVSYTGQAGMPDLVQGGNVLRPETSLKLSIRTPPTLSMDGIEEKLKQLLVSDPPYGARVTFDTEKGGAGWNAPATAAWLEQSIESASKNFFGKPPMTLGEGGSIPFMGMLGERYPEAQFLITGVLGPRSNAHGPNEFLEINTAKNLSACVAQILADERKSAG